MPLFVQTGGTDLNSERRRGRWRVLVAAALSSAPAFVQYGWHFRPPVALQPHTGEPPSVVMARATDLADAIGTEDEHNTYQEATFDAAAGFFASPQATPPEVVPRMHRIAKTCQLDSSASILDVATGTGALLPFFAAAGASLSNVVGVDLSSGMLNHAIAKFPSATFVQADINEYRADDERRFDRVVFNAVFGNLYDQAATLRHVASLLIEGGLVVISHPLGRRWLREVLHAKDPRMVPHDIPSQLELQDMISREDLGYSVVSVDDEDEYYCAVLRLEKG